MARLAAAEAREFIRHCVEKATEMNVPVSIAVVDPSGDLICLERMDDAGFITPEVAIAKAFTVAAFRSMSPRFPDGRFIQRWFRERNPQMLINASVLTGGKVVATGGSYPVFRGKDMVGCYAVSGGTSEQDEEIEIYARAKMGWSVMAEGDSASNG